MATFFQVDFSALVNMLLPVRLRKPITISWLNCLIQPIKELYEKFYQQRLVHIYNINHNSQVVYLQAALNDTFDATDRRIYITDGAAFDPLFVYTIPEDEPLWLGLSSEIGTTLYPTPQWLYTVGEVTYYGYNFLVMVPAGLSYSTERMNALVDKFRLASKRIYTILTY